MTLCSKNRSLLFSQLFIYSCNLGYSSLQSSPVLSTFFIHLQPSFSLDCLYSNLYRDKFEDDIGTHVVSSIPVLAGPAGYPGTLKMA
jgi:hypothetical protein